MSLNILYIPHKIILLQFEKLEDKAVYDITALKFMNKPINMDCSS